MINLCTRKNCLNAFAEKQYSWCFSSTTKRIPFCQKKNKNSMDKSSTVFSFLKSSRFKQNAGTLEDDPLSEGCSSIIKIGQKI